MIEASRRSFIVSAVGLIAAPAIVKVSSLMSVNAALVPGNALLTIEQIIREAVRLFKNSNLFLRGMERQFQDDYDFMNGEQWDKAQIGRALSIRLPNDFAMKAGPLWRDISEQERLERFLLPAAVTPLTLAAAAVAVTPEVLETPVTRRFWSK